MDKETESPAAACDGMTNTEFVTHLLTFCPTGAMSHMVVITAIEKYAQQCIEAGPEKFETSWLSGEAWIRTCKWLLARVEARMR